MQVDIGVPVFNGGWRLDRALSALRAQTHRSIRIFVSDNGSTDESLEVIHEHARQDTRVIPLEGPRDGSATSNFTFLLETAEAPAFMWAAHDDVWDRAFVAAGIRALDQGSNFFSSNWWVGDIASATGFSQPIHPLQFVQSSVQRERFLHFAKMNPRTHKCNLVYSLFSRDFLLRAAAIHDISDDALLSLAICYLGPGMTSDQVMFYKDNMNEARRLRASRALPLVSRRGRMFILEIAGEAVRRMGGLRRPPLTFEDYVGTYYSEACRLFPEYADGLREIAANHRRFTVRDDLVSESVLQ